MGEHTTDAARAESAMLREALEKVRDGIECESVSKDCGCVRCRAVAALASPSSSAEWLAEHDRRVWREAMEACAAAVRASRQRLSTDTLESIAREVLAVRRPKGGPTP